MHSDTAPRTKEAYLSGVSIDETLSARHLRELRDGSGISPEVIAEERITTIATSTAARQLGYTESWQQLPGLAFPVRAVDGTTDLVVLKPDHPRPKKDKSGKFVKYEWPYRQSHRLDVPRRCLASLFDPAVDLYVVEGKKKALALASRGLCAIAVWGVWAWGKKPAEHARCELLSDWDAIPLDGRRVFVPFDSDRDEKDNVDLAARHLAGRLAERGAEVYHVILPTEPDGSKNGADDLIVRHGLAAFKRCVEEALDRGPHGMEALRAVWRRQRAEIRDLKERAAATAALLELPTEKCDPGEKALLLTAAAELSKRQADTGATDYRSFCIDTMARRAGMSAGTYGRKLKRFYTGENRLFDYDRKPLNPDDPLDPRRSIYLRPARESCGTFTGILWTAITTAEARDDTWGGTREPKPMPLCPTHGDACDALKMSQLVCGGADEDGNLCGEFLGEPIQRRVSRNTDRQAALEVLVRERGWSTRQVGEAIKRSPMYVSRRLRVFDDPILAPLVLRTGLAVSTAEELLRAPDLEIRKRLAAEAAAANWTPTQARYAVAASRCNDSLQRRPPSPRLPSHIRALREELEGLDPSTLSVLARHELRIFLQVGQTITPSSTGS